MKRYIFFLVTFSFFSLFSENRCPIEYQSVGHINIVVDDIEEATLFYQKVFGAKPVQDFPHFRNEGFAKSAGFMENPVDVDVTIRFLELPTPEKFHLELMEYHSPKGDNIEIPFQTHDFGGVRHIALRVNNIDEAFAYVKKIKGVQMISSSEDYLPYKIDEITPEDFSFFDLDLEENKQEKEKVCKIIGNIRYFYFVDPYGVQWELEQGHEDIGSSE